jgi:hypothetical protein
MKDKKLIFKGILVAVLISLFIFFIRFAFIGLPKIGSTDFSYKIESCGEIGEPKKSSVAIKVLAHSIKFDQILSSYCNTNKNNLKLKYSRQGNDLRIDEIFQSATVTRCVCPIKIKGVIANLDRGDYKIRFIFDNRYGNQKEIISALKFVIK